MMNDQKVIRVLIVDDHAMVRSGLKNFIYAFDWMEPVGEAADGAQAVAFCTQNEVDVVLMDMIMPVMDGSEATRHIVDLELPVKIIILTSYHEQDLVEKALIAGATSYLLKNVSAEELAAAIRAAYSGQTMLAPEATQSLINSTRRKSEKKFNLTEREMEILALLAEGLSNLEISQNLSVTIATVKFHLTNIFQKLGAKNRVMAVTIAMDHNLVATQK